MFVVIELVGMIQADAKIRGLTNNPRVSGLNLIALESN
jgi:hypothetical protein